MLKNWAAVCRNMASDAKYAIRLLRKNPGFTLTAVFTLGLGLGLNTAVFTVYDAVALRKLPVKDPDTVVRLVRWYEEGRRATEFTPNEFEYIRSRTQSFVGAAAVSPPSKVSALEHLGASTEFLQAQLVSANYFPLLGVSPSRGRSFNADESSPVAVISERFWKRRFSSDPQVVGKTLLLNGTAFTLIGVTPASFAGTGVPPVVPDLWLPLSMHDAIAPRQETAIQILARRKSNVSPLQMQADIDRLQPFIDAVEPQSLSKTRALKARPATYFDTDSGGFDTTLTVIQVLMFAVGAVLMIGCVNLVNLLLARALERQREIAIRTSLGAAGRRIIQQLCTESAMLGLLGGAAGLAFSVAVCDFLSTAAFAKLASFGVGAEALYVDLRPSAAVLVYAVLLSVATGVLIGLAPARQALRGDLASAMKLSAPASIGGRSRLRSTLIAGQIAACMILLVVAGLLWHGLVASRQADPGFETKHVFALFLPPDSLGASTPEKVASRRRVLDKLHSVPQFHSVALAMNPPLLGHMVLPMQTGGSPSAGPAIHRSLWNSVSPDYFETLGIPLLRGRPFTSKEAEQHHPVILVSEAAARLFWPGEDPIGKRISTPKFMFDRLLAGRAFTVVGVVKTVRSTNLSKSDPAYVYFPAAADNAKLILVRANLTEAGAIKLMRDAVLEVDRSAAMQMVSISVESGPVQIQRLMTEVPATLAATLGALGLLLSAIGIYGVIACLVRGRAREIGLRMALGAGRAEIATFVLSQSLRPVLTGILIDLGGSTLVALLLRQMVVAPDMPDLLYGVSVWDPFAFLAVPLFLLLTVWIASSGPLRRAFRVDPAVALNYE